MEKDYCAQAIEAFLETLRNSFEILLGDEGCILVSPFLRSDNECIEIELITQSNGEIKITDNCDTLDYLFVNGLNVGRSKELQRRVGHIAKRFGVELHGEEVIRMSVPNELGRAIYSFVGAVQEISYLIYRKLRRPPPTFDEEVEKFLIANNVSYDPDFKLQGKSRENTFRFHINKQHQMLLEPVTATSYHAALVKAERLAFRWVDIRDLWPIYRKVAIIDDIEVKSQLWVDHPLKILAEYSNLVIKWSQNQRLIEALSSPLGGR